MLDQALGRRLALVLADAGFGKTTLLASWASGINAVVHDVTPADTDLSRFVGHVVDALRLRVPELPHELTAAVEGGHPPDTGGEERARPDAMAEALGGALEQHLLRDVALVLDNAHLLADGPAARFLAGLIRHAPPLLHVVLASRTTPPMPVGRLRVRGELVELHGADLDFTPDEVADLLTAALGESAAGLAHLVHRATAGWPVAVRLCVEALRDIEPAARAGHVGSLAEGHATIARLASAIYLREPPGTRRLLATVALFDEVTVELLEALGRPAREQVAALLRRGLFLEPGASGAGWHRLHTIARDAVARHGPDLEVARLRTAAATWFADNGLPHAALRALVAADRHDQVVELLDRCGSQMLGHGHADEVIQAVARLPRAKRDRSVERLAGEAHQLRGEWEQALASYARAADDGPLDPGLAWRMGLIHYLRGDLEAALAAYQRGRIGDEPSRDVALLLAWTASCHWMRGAPDECGRWAARALRVATRADDAQALAAAHTVLAMLAAYEGDRRGNGAHYLKALQHAEQAGDVLQLVRIRCNRGSHHLEEGAYLEALAELDIAIGLADVSGFAAFGALALTNRGEARLGLGRLEEAQRDFEAAVEVFGDLGSGLIANALHKLGTLRCLRGETAAARQAYEQALRHAEQAGDAQSLVPALAGLARLLADEEPERATELAHRAMAAGAGISAVSALLAAGWVALARGDREAARRHADDAAGSAEVRRDRPGLAEATTLRAAAAEDGRQALTLADAAVALWADTGDPIGTAHAELVRAERLEPAAARAVIERLRTDMRAIGCRQLDARAEAALARLERPSSSTVRFETLGGFRLLRDGRPVPSSAWKSRKARDLVKILLSRRGRPIAQDQIIETLWPGEAPNAVANRLNVLVSTIRSLLDPDRQAGADGFLSNDGEALRLRLDRLEVDVESFLADATAGTRLLREGRVAEGIERLARAEASYPGDFLEEDPYADWAAPLREGARVTYREVASRLARHARDHNDADAAIRYLLRILERDPYDEDSHLRLVSVLTASGRHGDARRHYRGYCARMEELGIEAVPFLPSPA
ncbi:MAG: tetratricopeptide repeat protein [Micromonosporaceae bacterium]|nr:tetratricopeptide repeat protein [Micromonosporaceae bacterium]